MLVDRAALAHERARHETRRSPRAKSFRPQRACEQAFLSRSDGRTRADGERREPLSADRVRRGVTDFARVVGPNDPPEMLPRSLGE